MNTKTIKCIMLFLIFFLVLISNNSISFSAGPVGMYSTNVSLLENFTWQQNLTGVYHSATVIGDLNNDNLLDVIIAGCAVGGVTTCTTVADTKVYIHNGTSLVENSTWEGNLTGAALSSLALGDINNDNLLDLVLTGYNGSSGITKIYINNGTSLVENFTWQQNISATNVYDGSVAFGDVDNDGDLDLAITGADSAGENGIYIDNGTSFVQDKTWLSGISYAGQGLGSTTVAFGDLNNDEYLDLVYLGSFGANFYSAVYINNQTSLIENTTWEGDFGSTFGYPSLILGDIENHGRLDMVCIGARAGDHILIYNNTGNEFNLKQTSLDDFTGYFDGSLMFGDYDNDGYLDMYVIGKEAGRAYGYYYNQSAKFILDDKISQNISSQIIQGALAWFDVNNDSKLDLIITGDDADTKIAKIYINNNTISNTLPSAPNSSFSTVYENNKLTLTWGNGTDTETPALGLYYNLRLGTSKLSNNIVSGKYGGGEDNGYFGNMMQRKSITLAGSWLQANTLYYWSVQTIDTALAKSTWSFEQNFTTGSDVIDPVITLNAPINIFNTTNFIITFNATISDNVNLTNVSLYGNWSGLHLNQSNASLGKNNTYYIFTKNLTAYGDGSYSWLIQASDANNNSANSSERRFRIDTTYPVINLVTPANDSTWSSSQLVTFTYNVTDQGIANCSLIINNIINQTDDSIDVNSEQVFTQTLPNTYYNFSINCTDAVNYLNRSETRKLRVYYEEQGSVIDNPSKKSSSSVAETKSLGSIDAGETKSVEFTKDLGITEIAITASKDLSSISVTVNEIPSSNSEVNNAGLPSEDVYKYLKITSKAKNEDISKAQISFKIPLSWLSSNNYNEDKVNLMHYTNAWNSLPTKKINKDSDYIYYKAETNGFSLYAITAEKKIEVNETKTEKNITEEIVKENIKEVKQPAKSKNYILLLIFLIFVGIICYFKRFNLKKILKS